METAGLALPNVLIIVTASGVPCAAEVMRHYNSSDRSILMEEWRAEAPDPSDQMDVVARPWSRTKVTLQRWEVTCRRAGTGEAAWQPKERRGGLEAVQNGKQLQHLSERRDQKQLFIRTEQYKIYSYYQTNIFKLLRCFLHMNNVSKLGVRSDVGR